MKKIILIFFAFMLAGCATTSLPNYIHDKKPYKKRFYATLPQAQRAVEKVLSELGWQVAEAVDPLVYEQSESNDLTEQQLLLVTAVRQTPLFVGTRYARMNIFLRSQKNISEVEIRYMTVTSALASNFTNYGDKSTLTRIMARVEAALGGKVLE